jgi:DNA mismatch repair protein MutS
MSALTPMQKQYNDMKQQNADSLLLFRMGDFYECFYADAEIAARVLGITLTGRGKDENKVPMAGIPYHALSNYLPKLLKAGIKVALAEQMEEPQSGKLVERKVIKIYTPGTTIDEKTLNPDVNNYLASVYYVNDKWGLAFVDISTGELKVFSTMADSDLAAELNRIEPAEVICSHSQLDRVRQLVNITPYTVSDSSFNLNTATTVVQGQFGVANFKGFGIEAETAIISALGSLVAYIQECQKTVLSHLQSVSLYHRQDFMLLDPSTIRNLEIIYANSGQHKFTLLNSLDECISSMGKRKLRNWILHPLVEAEQISQRYDAVEKLISQVTLLDSIRGELRHVYDIERIISRIGLASANARDLQSLNRSCIEVQAISALLAKADLSQRLSSLAGVLHSTAAIAEVARLIESAIHPEPPITITEGSIIADGYNAEVDELRALSHNSKQILAEIQAREVQRTGISNLKISYNKVFGYYLEITKSNLTKVPTDYIRKQTLANAERYITPELKELEDKIINAESKLQELEYGLFVHIRSQIAQHSQSFLTVADVIAELDVLTNFAYLTRQYQYCRPQIKTEQVLAIKRGRHPVIERALGSKFIANDLTLTGTKNLVILTGPNMSGKSTYIRQAALLVYMAQLGSFVPADSMEYSLADRIFTRVGAADNLAAGESTFMVEMTETANILNNATKDSLVILDEVGRGTSTYDGVAIAWSIAEYIHNHLSARTLFATHYHELIQLESSLKTVANYQVHVDDAHGEIKFTHHIAPGSTSRSYGVHVASIAGVPKSVVKRAEEILSAFETDKQVELKDSKRPAKPRSISPAQTSLI